MTCVALRPASCLVHGAFPTWWPFQLILGPSCVASKHASVHCSVFRCNLYPGPLLRHIARIFPRRERRSQGRNIFPQKTKNSGLTPPEIFGRGTQIQQRKSVTIKQRNVWLRAPHQGPFSCLRLLTRAGRFFFSKS